MVREVAVATPLCTVNEMSLEWPRPPLAACTEIDALPVIAVADAPITNIVFAPLCSVNGLCGFVVTPAGKPRNVTWTFPEKPFSGCTPT